MTTRNTAAPTAEIESLVGQAKRDLATWAGREWTGTYRIELPAKAAASAAEVVREFSRAVSGDTGLLVQAAAHDLAAWLKGHCHPEQFHSSVPPLRGPIVRYLQDAVVFHGFEGDGEARRARLKIETRLWKTAETVRSMVAYVAASVTCQELDPADSSLVRVLVRAPGKPSPVKGLGNIVALRRDVKAQQRKLREEVAAEVAAATPEELAGPHLGVMIHQVEESIDSLSTQLGGVLFEAMYKVVGGNAKQE